MTRKDIIEIELISLKARRLAARGFIMNDDMKVEARLLEDQIEALEKELKRVKNNGRK